MIREITTHVKRMNIMRDTTHTASWSKTDYTTVIELEGSISIDPTRPIIICQEEPND